MTGNKMRALVLSALMVLSVFAGTIALTGTAAAANTASVTSTIEYDAGNGGGTIEVAFNKSVSSVSNATVWVDGTQYDVSGSVGTGQTLTIPRSAHAAGDLKPSQSVQVFITGQDADGNNVTVGERHVGRTVKTTSQNIDLSNAQSETAVYVGEPVAVIDGSGGTDTQFDILRDGSWISTKKTGAGSSIFVLATSEYDASSNITLTSNAGGSQTLDLRNLGLSATADSTELTTNDGITGTLSAGAPDRQLNVYLVDSNGDPASTVKSITLDGSGEGTFSFSNPGAGEYTVVAQDVNTGNIAQTSTLNVTEVVGDANFATSVVTEERGDVAEITVQFTGGASSGTVFLGSSDVNFQANMTVVDDDGDGEVTILWNTAASQNELTGGLSAMGDDTVTVNNTGGSITDPVQSPVDTGEYPVSVEVNDDEKDIATVIVEERSSTQLSTHTAFAGGSYQNASSAEQGNTIAVNPGSGQADLVVLRLAATGLEGNVSANTDLNGSDNQYRVFLKEQGETVGVNQQPITLDTDNMTLNNPEDDVYFLTVSANELLQRGAEPGDKFTATFNVSGETQLDATFELVRGQASFDMQADSLFVEAREDAAITGTSTWAPGTSLTVRLRSSGGTSPFVKTNDTITVQEDGTWSGTFDLSEQADGQTFDATLVAQGGGESVSGQIGELSASVSFSDQQAEDSGTLVTVDSATLSDGGFVAIHLESATGPVVGVSDYLEAGSHSDIQIRLDQAIDGETTLVAMPHKDTNNNQVYEFGASEGESDTPYTSGGAAVTDDATVSISTPTATDEPTDTATDEPTDTATASPTEGDGGDETTAPPATETTSPGFGLIVALLALAGAALLALRRD